MCNCKLVPVLRIIGFVFLVLAFIACAIGFVAPFWVRLPHDRQDDSRTTGIENVPPTPAQQGQLEVTVAVTTAATSTTTNSPSIPGSSIFNKIFPNGSYEGLWAKCDQNLACRCFWENEFKMEKDFPAWHQAAQGLFGIGLVLLLIALVTASFHVCCCHCCQESFAIATVVGSIITAGLLLVTVSLAVYGGFSTVLKNVQVIGTEGVFDWAFYLSLGGVVVALLAAILFLIDGRRRTNDSDGDGEETAKMV